MSHSQPENMVVSAAHVYSFPPFCLGGLTSMLKEITIHLANTYSFSGFVELFRRFMKSKAYSIQSMLCIIYVRVEISASALISSQSLFRFVFHSAFFSTCSLSIVPICPASIAMLAVS